MGSIDNYKIDIIGRTKEILEIHYPYFMDNGREVTFLMNCLLGLIIAIFENEKKNRKVLNGNIDDEFLSLIPDKLGYFNSRDITENLTNQDLTQVFVNVQHKDDLVNKNKYWFLNKLRNGIAHQNIEGINENGRWSGVRIWNLNTEKKDFEIIFQISELKTFVTKLADMCLNKE